MNPNIEIPDRLYKYRAFSAQVVQMLVMDKLFFADPLKFNDPLDSKPHLENDLSVLELEELLRGLVSSRVTREMEEITRSLKIKGSKLEKRTKEHILEQSKLAADKVISEIHYFMSEPDEDIDRQIENRLTTEIEDELRKRYVNGVLCLAENPECPLMWSHYGDQHKGVCLGYSVGKDVAPKVLRIDYEKGRLVKASDIAGMLEGDNAAKQRVDNAVLCRKAPSWQYEREWRLIGEQGDQNNSLELEEVIFGLKCSQSIVFSIVKGLQDRSHQVKFFQIRERRSSFDLHKEELDTGEMNASLPLRFNDIYDWFDDISDCK